MRYPLIILLAVTAFGSYLHAEIGCMDKSYHLKKTSDYKQYHYVQCACPCKQYPHYFHKGYRCSKCKHAHDPQLTTFIRSNYSAAGDATYSPIDWRITRSLANLKVREHRKTPCCENHCDNITDTR